MATRHLGQIGRWALLVSPIVIVPVAFIALEPWLDRQNGAISDVTAAACAIFVMGYSVFLAARVNRRLDEVQIAGQRFAQTKGMTIGIFAAVLVMIFPPSMNALVDLANTIAAGSPDKAVKYGIVLGYTLLMLLQGVGLVAVSIWWERRVFGGRE
jgi:HAMP domain-containing protein